MDVTAREGEDISLECEVGGDPGPVFTWTRESGEVMERAREARLTIRRVMAEDEGVYTCRAENAVGAVEGSVSLIVHGEKDHVKKWFLLSDIENHIKIIEL